MAQKTISKEFIKIDEENFEIVETRETTTPVNLKRVAIELKSMRSNLKTDVQTIMQNTNIVWIGCERYNTVLVDLAKASKELGYEMEIPGELSYELLYKEITDDEAEKKNQEEKSRRKTKRKTKRNRSC